MNEIWRSVKDYEGLYEVSNWSRVRNCRTGCVLRPGKDIYGYLFVILYKGGIPKRCSVHRLVGMVFPDLVGWTEDAKGRPFGELQINHKDKNKENNRVENLEWCNCPYNIRYSLSNKVYMYTLDGKLCGLWPSTAECDRYRFDHSAIAKCCNGTRKNHKGFKWSYEPPKVPKALAYYVI